MVTDEGSGGFTVERILGAPPERVFAAFVEPAKLEHWFVVEGFTTPADRMRVDAQPGGRVDAVMVGDDGTEIPFGFEYVELERPGRVVLAFAEPRETVTVTLREEAGGTHLTYTYLRWPAPEDVAASRQGVVTMLDTIEDGIARGII
jgi:uncharacterized protein YndB with AHSA1/START domain